MFQEKGIQGSGWFPKKTSVRKKISCLPLNLTTDLYALKNKQAPKVSAPGKNASYCLKFQRHL